MALTDYNEYLIKLRENRVVDFQMSGSTVRSQRYSALWRVFLPTPPSPTASVAATSESPYSIGPLPSVGPGQLSILAARLNNSNGAGAGLLIMDLLNISGGMNATVTTPQTTNIPTAPLTRYTNGEGVMAAIIINTQIGTTLTTATVSYTNTTPTAGRISIPVSFGGSGYREIGSIIPIPLQPGDTGVQSIQSVTIGTSTGTAGNFGVILFKPLCLISMESTTGAIPIDSVSTGGIIGGLCEVKNDACLTVAAITNTNQSMSGAIILGEI